jgi:hypothetical protein
VGVTVSNTIPRTTLSSPTFAERLRAAHEQEQKAQRRPLRSWFRGPRAGFAPDVAVEPHDRPRQRDEFVHDIAS